MESVVVVVVLEERELKGEARNCDESNDDAECTQTQRKRNGKDGGEKTTKPVWMDGRCGWMMCVECAGEVEGWMDVVGWGSVSSAGVV